jgi:hypothetical protein
MFSRWERIWGVKRGRAILRVALTGAMVMGAAVLLWPRGQRGPVYQGKKLSEWIKGAWRESYFGPMREERAEAIRAIGTNGLPFLIKWIAEAQPPLLNSWDRAIYKVGRLGGDLFKYRYDKMNRGADGATALAILGPAARPALPELRKLAKSAKGISSYALAAFGEIQISEFPPYPGWPGVPTNSLGPAAGPKAQPEK